MRIGYFADGPWSHKAFELLIVDKSIEIVFIVPRTDSFDKVLYEFSQKYNIPYLKGANINSEEFYVTAKGYSCDIFVSMSFNQIFRSRLINVPILGTINCHAGGLPYYRGRNILNWVLINDEKQFGITVHFIDEGIDTGDIIVQNYYPINDNDTYKTLLEKAHIECANSLFTAIKSIQNNNFTRTKQSTIHPVGFYCGQRGIGDEIINWNQESRELFNFIRAICTPGPKAQTIFKNTIVSINSASLIHDAPKYKGKEGQIVGKTKNGLVVKTKDTTIEIMEIESEYKLKVGDCLGK